MEQLVQIVDAALADAARRSGEHLVCRPGCMQCCVGVFPIAQQDAARLRDGLAALSATDPARAEAILGRVRHALERLDPWLPGDMKTGTLREDDEAMILFEQFANDEVCPVLDPVTGTCEMYAWRPILCRTFGPPMRQDGDDGDINLGTCELCYIHATTEEIAACELDPHVVELERESNERFNAEHGLCGETLIAYALRGPASEPVRDNRP